MRDRRIMSVLRRSRVRSGLVLGLWFLAACAPDPVGYRDLSAPIGQTGRYSPEAMAGEWVVQAAFADIAPERMVYDATTQSLTFSGRSFPVRPDGLVVMWLDADLRSAVVGSADGTAGFILDRGAQMPPDRFDAAVDVLEFYGWDTDQLERVE